MCQSLRSIVIPNLRNTHETSQIGDSWIPWRASRATTHNVRVPSITTHASYDDVPYEAGLSPRTHPQTAAVIGQLFGLKPAGVASARVLEIGCGPGNNLLPMAYSLPGASFVGIDLSARHIEAAAESAARLGLRNARFLEADVRDYVPDQAFDYVICHGVFSWVPPETRAAILETCRRALSPQGIAYLSYNAMPGWHVRGAFREMLRAHARFFPTPRERVEQARAFASFLVDSTSQLTGGSSYNAAYHTMLQEELSIIQRFPDFYVMHEHLADENHPLYFLDALDEISAHGLRYLGDANFSTMLTENLPRDVAQKLDAIAPTRELIEQYRDFVVDRHFRESLLVRDDVTLDGQLDARAVRHLAARALLTTTQEGAWNIPQAAGLHRRVESPLVVAILEALADAMPRSLTFDELQSTLASPAWPAGLAVEDRADHLAAVLLSLFASDAVELRCWEPLVAGNVGERPRVFQPAAVLRTELGVPSPHHTLLGFDSATLWLLPYADGTRTVAELAAILNEQVEQGVVSVERADAANGPSTSLTEDVVTDALEQLRRAGMLEAGPPSLAVPR